jgi:UTP-glucose-1-phosphate uridylyltransferase
MAIINNNNKTTLCVLAAGLGSRYGGLKQMDSVGPSGESIMEYSVYDAIQVGFSKIVFVIRHSFDDEFRRYAQERFLDKIKVDIVYQELDSLPEGYHVPEDREKPWGTNHAILMAKTAINEPFCVINADDFYGRESFIAINKFLQNIDGKKNEYAMVGFKIQNTLSESGSVARGVCCVDESGKYLTDITERTHIELIENRIQYLENDLWFQIPENTPVSMNMWGLTPDYFVHSEQYFKTFLDEKGKELKSEFFIPSMISYLIRNNMATIKMLDTDSQWFGVTYQKDKPLVINKIQQQINHKIYPENLWK